MSTSRIAAGHKTPGYKKEPEDVSPGGFSFCKGTKEKSPPKRTFKGEICSEQTHENYTRSPKLLFGNFRIDFFAESGANCFGVFRKIIKIFSQLFELIFVTGLICSIRL